MAEDFELDPFLLSRKLERLARDHGGYRGRLAANPDAKQEFRGEFPGLTVLHQVQRLHGEDPLRPVLLRWVQRLTEERLSISGLHQEAHLEHRTQYKLKVPDEQSLSLFEMRTRALSSALSVQERGLWWGAMERAEAPLAEQRDFMRRHSSEVASRLGVQATDEHWSPLCAPDTSVNNSENGEPATGTNDPLDTSEDFLSILESVATTILRESRDVAQTSMGRGWQGFVECLLAHDASEGWPARLAPDTLRGLLGDGPLFREVRLSSASLPLRLCPMSFPRASIKVGRALSRALCPTNVPYIASRDPDDLLGHETGELLYHWTTSAIFAEKILGLGRARAKEQHQVFSLALVARARLQASRLLVMIAASRGGAHWQQIHERLRTNELSVGLPLSSLLARFRVSQDEPTRFVGFLSAAHRFQRFVHQYDEDWYLNPRAQEELRARLSAPATTTRALDDCLSGWKDIYAHLN